MKRLDNRKLRCASSASKISEWLSSKNNCGNCGDLFTVKSFPQSVVGLENSVGKSIITSMYLICRKCRHQLLEQGLDGISVAKEDARLAAILIASKSGGEA